MSLRHAGLEVTLIEALDQVMAPLDFELAQLLHENIRQNGVKLHLGDPVSAFSEDSLASFITLKSGAQVRAELVLLAIYMNGSLV